MRPLAAVLLVPIVVVLVAIAAAVAWFFWQYPIILFVALELELLLCGSLERVPRARARRRR